MDYFFLIFLIIFSCSQSLTYARYIILKQQCKLYISTNLPAMIPTYGRVLSTIEKTLQELVEEY